MSIGYAALIRHTDDDLSCCTYTPNNDKVGANDMSYSHSQLLQDCPAISEATGQHVTLEHSRSGNPFNHFKYFHFIYIYV